MAYARITFMKPIAGREEDAATLNRDLVGLYREQAGCQLSHTLVATDGSGKSTHEPVEVENAAQPGGHDRSMFLRSRLHLLIEHGHQDRGSRPTNQVC